MRRIRDEIGARVTTLMGELLPGEDASNGGSFVR
jgi:hypothetical protein